MNLRKDHCRNPAQQNDPRTCKTNSGARGPRAPDLLGLGGTITGRRRSTCVGVAFPAAQTNPGAKRAKELERISNMPRRPRDGVCSGCCVVFFMSKRLSATDISALASMKNVAKCDTWCELQNPVNHRVFERKLRPKPLGRGHVCLGVTQRCPPQTSTSRRTGGGCWPPVRHGSRLAQIRVLGDERRGNRWLSNPRCHAARASRTLCLLDDPQCVASATLTTRPQVRRGYPLSLSISISGGKETYKDSPSNGERTGNSPG